jgi:hypothetical protein
VPTAQTRTIERDWYWTSFFAIFSFSYPEPFLRAVNGARRGALAKSISNWHLIGYNEGYCSNTGYILLPCFYGIRFWIWPEPLVAPRVRRALGTRMPSFVLKFSIQIYTEPTIRTIANCVRCHINIYMYYFFKFVGKRSEEKERIVYRCTIYARTCCM